MGPTAFPEGDVLYEEPPDPVEEVRAAHGERRVVAFMWAGAGAAAVLVSPWMLAIDLAIGAITATVGVACVLVGAWDWRMTTSHSPSRVTTLRIHGPPFPAHGLAVALVQSVHSKRFAPDDGIFVITQKNGRRRRVAAGDLADPDAYWEALKRVAPEAKGWEWVDGAKRYWSDEGR